jgi:CRISPR system Cascade subunit CasB
MSIKETSKTSSNDKIKTTTINYGQIVEKIAKMMTNGNLSTGDLAELRRISPEEPFTPPLWRVLLIFDLDNAPAWINQKQWERHWATLMMGMAHCSGLHEYNI